MLGDSAAAKALVVDSLFGATLPQAAALGVSELRLEAEGGHLVLSVVDVSGSGSDLRSFCRIHRDFKGGRRTPNAILVREEGLLQKNSAAACKVL